MHKKELHLQTQIGTSWSLHWNRTLCNMHDYCNGLRSPVNVTMSWHCLLACKVLPATPSIEWRSIVTMSCNERRQRVTCHDRTRFERISTQNLKNVMSLVFSCTASIMNSGHRSDRLVMLICTPKCVFIILGPKTAAFLWSGRVDQPMFPTLTGGIFSSISSDNCCYPGSVVPKDHARTNNCL